jgi:hypothetical protein
LSYSLLYNIFLDRAVDGYIIHIIQLTIAAEANMNVTQFIEKYSQHTDATKEVENTFENALDHFIKHICEQQQFICLDRLCMAMQQSPYDDGSLSVELRNDAILNAMQPENFLRRGITLD